ncbi:MAG: tRNA 2-thiouridine(34) synthase MnmA [Clostridiales bacterium]|nr:tRNA 2-thiouridine(34) synthase MnmA [Clostridiales bacterium]MCI7573357.1 tRNA 2-thiouridine(34) synthase MnmA [Clostridiales bacterium]
MERAIIGMSGGVDSSVAAYLMKKAGYECIGATMRLYDSSTEESTCCSLDDVEDARAVASRLGIRHYVFNFKDDFDRQVIQKFVTSYEQGLTPNPCIDCNRHLKFDRLLRRAQELGCNWVVSGHYAQIRQDPVSGRYLLYKAADRAKDQTYFLACLNQEQMAHIQFPLGGLTKTQVRQIAQENGFVNARKRDSQDICFVPDGDYGAFLQRYTGKTYPEGDFLDLQGQVVGHHRGAACYTLGQRKGLGLAMGAPVYVCAKDMQRNTVTVGPGEALFSPALLAGDWNWYPFPTLTAPMRVTVKTRHSQFEQAATVYPEENGFARVEFDQPQRAVTPGQAVVLYDGDMVVGGGTITEALSR